MSVTDSSDHITYYKLSTSNRLWSHLPEEKTTKEEWTQRFEFVYKSSKDYMALNKAKKDAYVDYVLYNHKHLYTDEKETTSAMETHLYKIYYNKQKNQSEIKANILKAFKEKFPNIKKPASDLEHYIHCCEIYASHRLKGIEYNLPFPVEDNTPSTQEEFKLGVEESMKPVLKTLEEFVDFFRTKSKPSLIGIKEKKKNVKKHTLSILLTQEKEKTRKLQEILEQKSPITNNSSPLL